MILSKFQRVKMCSYILIIANLICGAVQLNLIMLPVGSNTEAFLIVLSLSGPYVYFQCIA
jgi:hypothetical protein